LNTDGCHGFAIPALIAHAPDFWSCLGRLAHRQATPHHPAPLGPSQGRSRPCRYLPFLRPMAPGFQPLRAMQMLPPAKDSSRRRILP
jgi:hypothetical protein